MSCNSYGAAFAVGCALLLVSPLASAAAQGTRPAWPQAQSDIEPDAGIVFGVLPNGLRYAIKKNPAPASQVSIRLRIASGALDEALSEKGIAHFLEHLMFRGTGKCGRNGRC